MDKELEEAINKGQPCAILHFDKEDNVTHMG